MSLPSFHPLSWAELQRIVFVLAQEVLDEHRAQPFDRICSISRGGLVVARMLSDTLNLPISNFTIVSYSGINQAGEPLVKEELGVAINGERILLVDEIVDSGATLEKAIQYLTALSPKEIKTAVAVFKPRSSFKPEYFGLESFDWVVFPYEVKETVEQLWPMLQAIGESKEQARARFISFGFPEDQVTHWLSSLE